MKQNEKDHLHPFKTNHPKKIKNYKCNRYLHYAFVIILIFAILIGAILLILGILLEPFCLIGLIFIPLMFLIGLLVIGHAATIEESINNLKKPIESTAV